MSARRPAGGLEARISGGACLGILIAWTVLFLFDLGDNGVLGKPGSVWLPPLIYLGLFFTAEYKIPWLGIGLFLLIWPQMLPVRELGGRFLGAGLLSFPECWGGPLTAALAVAVWLRMEVARRGNPMAASGPQSAAPGSETEDAGTSIAAGGPWRPLLRLLLWVLVGAWLLALVVGVWRALSGMPQWVIQPADWRSRNDPWALTAWRPWVKTAQYLPPFLLGLLLLAGSRRAVGGVRQGGGLGHPPSGWLLAALGATGLIAAVQVLFAAQGHVWSFDRFPPAGPFAHRNTTAPFLVLSSAALLVSIGRWSHGRSWGLTWRWAGVALVLVMLGVMVLTRSRNGLLLALVAAWLLLLVRATWRRAGAAALLAFLGWAVVFLFPIKAVEAVPGSSLRLVETLSALRSGNLWIPGDGRGLLFKAAWEVFLAHPLAGAGVGAFPMVAHPSTPMGGIFGGEVFYSPHSIPLELLSEIGVLGALAWCGLWLALPMVALIRWRRGNGWAWLALIMGLANLGDTLWLVPGAATTAVLFLVLGQIEAEHGLAIPGGEADRAAANLQTGN